MSVSRRDRLCEFDISLFFLIKLVFAILLVCVVVATSSLHPHWRMGVDTLNIAPRWAHNPVSPWAASQLQRFGLLRGAALGSGRRPEAGGAGKTSGMPGGGQ